jgi:lysophospholipase L1-like esterase
MKKTEFYYSILTTTVMFFVFASLHASAQKKKIFCVGNSITYGYGLSNPSSESYPAQMQVLLGTDEWEVGNFGSSGRTMLKSGGYSYWDDQLYKDALASNPDCIMIELGTNDSKQWLWDSHGSEFKTDYKAMVQSFQNLSTKPEIWIGLLIPGEKTDWAIYNSYIKNKVNPKIKEVALEMGLGLIDLYADLDSAWGKWCQSDSVHPNTAGAAIIAQKVGEMLLMPKPEIKYESDTVIAPDGYDFQWYLNGNPISSDKGGNLKELAINESGKYKVSVKLNADNETRIVSKELDIQVTSVYPKYLGQIKVYPNPVSNQLTICSDNIKHNKIEIFDLMGNLLMIRKTAGDSVLHLPVSLPEGIYFLKLSNGMQYQFEKFIVENKYCL